ncbi:glycosyltransferase family 4 protein [Saccharicrinis aurantiacus]|uniref:glycosyltransferase family 4 protein n=1 Tax=Saccharicrinis aurantiacus TaxID=1849719 RepID=UPI00083868D9|nr:glycosyltransferase family 4 protein [Saccharicrinis aurantiacus]
MQNRILIIGPISDTLGGTGVAGVARHIEGLAQNLQTEGQKITIWYHKQNKSLHTDEGIKIIGDTYLQKGIKIIKGIVYLLYKQNNFIKEYPIARKLTIAYQYIALQKVLKKNDFTIIHIHSLNSYIGNTLQLLKREGFKLPKIIYTDHGFWQNPHLRNCKNNVYYKNIKYNTESADAVIYISEYAKQQLVEYCFWNKRFKKIPNPVLTKNPKNGEEYNTPQNIKTFLDDNPNKKMIFFNGYTESIERKKLDILLTAIESNSDLQKNVILIAICNNKGTNYIKKNHWSFPILALEKQPFNVIRAIYNECYCLVNPSLSESFGLVYIEALQHGKPIIGFKRVINEFKTNFGMDIGYGFTHSGDVQKDKEKLASLIVKLLSNNYSSQSIISKARNLSWDRQIFNFLELYKS